MGFAVVWDIEVYLVFWNEIPGSCWPSGEQSSFYRVQRLTRMRGGGGDGCEGACAWRSPVMTGLFKDLDWNQLSHDRKVYLRRNEMDGFDVLMEQRYRC